MEVVFKNKKFQKLCHSDKDLMKAYGKHCARKIKMRLDDLNATPNIEAFRSLPRRCHELKGGRKGQLSLDLEHPLRLIFEPINEDVQRKEDGGLDWKSVSAIRIINVENTHD